MRYADTCVLVALFEPIDDLGAAGDDFDYEQVPAGAARSYSVIGLGIASVTANASAVMVVIVPSGLVPEADANGDRTRRA
jgi:hypothetical protein